MTKQKCYDLVSNFMVKCWQSGKKLYFSMSAVAAAGSQTLNLILKKCSKIGTSANLSPGYVTLMRPYFINLDRNC